MNENETGATIPLNETITTTKSDINPWDILYIIDWCVAFILCIITLPIALIAILWIFTVARGNPFFFQERVGLSQKPFILFKIRTMRHAQKTAKFCEKNDPRLLPLGQFLRKIRIDELPQLLNVLRGEMALVGPRPEQVPFVNQFLDSIPNYAFRFRVKPGLTGLAQVHQGYVASEDGTRVKLAYDTEYIRSRGFRIWWHIIVNTVRVILTGHGAR